MDVEFKNNVDCPVKDLLALIKQDDIESLQGALLDVIHKSQPESEIYLYEQDYGLYAKNNKGFSPKLIDCRGKDKNDHCFNKSQLHQSSSDSDSIKFDGFNFLPTQDYVQVFTVESERSSRGLLITINKDVIDEKYIYTLISAYNHQVYLLRNKDTDSLTGLYNRQSFNTKLNKIHENFGYEKRSVDEPCVYCFALFDIDLFKVVNDKFGHVYGDEVLLIFSNIMKETFRDADLLFRYGGEEFAVLLHDVNLEQADSILNRFRTKIQELTFPMQNTVTTSIGYCEFNNTVTLSTIVERADKALYYAKEHGRNKSCCFEALLKDNKIQEIIIDEGDVELF